MPISPSPTGFETLLADLLVAHERHDAAGVAALLQRHEEHADGLRAAVARLQRMGLLDAAAGDAGYPSHLGDFRLLQRIGTGGMGVVFLAEQESLRRKVAVKLVRPELLLSPVARERFQREVETIAQLQHPGIVPVLAVGQHDGVPYFAMEYVPGCSLQEVLMSLLDRHVLELRGEDLARSVGAMREASEGASWCQGSWWQSVTRLIASVATTVAYVHARGILHRDLKPSNIMITAQGHTLLLDFGLAHVDDEARLTGTGAEVGSLAYMSPEQSRGEALDERTDVYSLGVTLYQMLALRLPFAEGPREELRLAIQQGRARPLRECNRALPRDLELIVSTAMDLDRAQRYPSIAAMAADLQNVLAHRPIAARPVGLGIRLQRWRHRHPFASGAALVAAVMLLSLPWLLAWLQHERHLQLQEARAVAEADLEQARAAIELMWQKASDLGELRDPAANVLRQQLYHQTLSFYRALHERHPEDADVARAVVAVHRSQAVLALQTGRLADAVDALQAAYAQIAQDPSPDGVPTLRSAAEVAKVDAKVRMERGEWALVDDVLDRLDSTLQRWQEVAPDDLGAALLHADSLNLRSHLRGNQGRPAEKLALLQRALIEKRALAGRSNDPAVHRSLAQQCSNLAELLLADADGAATAAHLYVEALRILDGLPPADCGDTLTLRGEVVCGLGIARLSAGDLQLAAQSLEAAYELQLGLCERQPHKPEYQYQLARTCCARARCALGRGEAAMARDFADRAAAAVAVGLQAVPDSASLEGIGKDAAALRVAADSVIGGRGAAAAAEATAKKH